MTRITTAHVDIDLPDNIRAGDKFTITAELEVIGTRIDRVEITTVGDRKPRHRQGELQAEVAIQGDIT